MSPQDYLARYLLPMSAPATGGGVARLAERHFYGPPEPPAAAVEWRVASLYSAGVECGDRDSLVQLGREVQELVAQAAAMRTATAHWQREREALSETILSSRVAAAQAESRAQDAEARRQGELQAAEARLREAGEHWQRTLEAADVRSREIEARMAQDLLAAETRRRDTEQRLQRELQAMERLFKTSRSWRVTAPFRAAGDLARRTVRAWRRLRARRRLSRP